jgi:4'-phosphopantetheinyl transferase
MRPRWRGRDAVGESLILSLNENAASGNSLSTGADPDGAPAPLRLVAPIAGVALWWCELSAPPARIRVMQTWLSSAETERADRFGTPALRERYVVGRATLRVILAGVLASTPRDVVIVRGERGRPQLGADSGLDFNVSHTAGVALIGTVQAARIGVDVERLDRPINVPGIARKFLTKAERSALAQLDADSARRQVLRLWTCKEAMSKATGDALSAPFASLDVALHQVNDALHEPNAALHDRTATGDFTAPRIAPVLRSGPAPYEPTRWSLHACAVPPGHVATMALWRR